MLVQWIETYGALIAVFVAAAVFASVIFRRRGKGQGIRTETAIFVHQAFSSFTAFSERNPIEWVGSLMAIEDMVSRIVRDHDGRIIYAYNGTSCSFFRTGTSAVRAAIAISQSKVETAHNLPLTVGIHAGPIYLHRGRCYGSSINTAAYVCAEARAAESHIVSSGTATALVKDHVPEGWTLMHLGERILKGSARPMDFFSVVKQGDVPPGLSAFISYRRKGGAEIARLVSADLQSRRVKTFLDLDDLGPHHFDERIHQEIDAAANFILILSDNSLDASTDEGDWLRREIAHAISTRRNIIPLLKDGFAYPKPETLPKELQDLPRYNSVRYSHEYFGATMNRVASFLVDEVGRASRTTSPVEKDKAMEGENHVDFINE